MLVKTRKNKGYTSILLEEVSEKAFQEAMDTYNSIKGSKIIKPGKKAWERFVELHSLTLDNVKAGEHYQILGTVFTVVRNLDYSRPGSNMWCPIVRYYNKEKCDYEEFGIISTDNLAIGVHETCFENQTGKLLYF